jgi:hypothetical protein
MLKIGVNLPSFGVDETTGVREHARHAEELGLESIWVGDHLIPVRPFLDSTMVLATAAAVTERVKIGFGVMILALRPAAWAATADLVPSFVESHLRLESCLERFCGGQTFDASRYPHVTRPCPSFQASGIWRRCFSSILRGGAGEFPHVRKVHFGGVVMPACDS